MLLTLAEINSAIAGVLNAPVAHYASSLDAMHEAEKWLDSQDQWLSYESALLVSTKWERGQSRAKAAIHASSFERAIAFLHITRPELFKPAS